MYFFSCIISPTYAVYSDTQKYDDQTQVPNQLIVKFKSGHDPSSLELKVQQRLTLNQSFVGKLQNLFSNMINKSRPEIELQQLEKAEASAGVIDYQMLENDTTDSLFVLTTDGKKSYKQVESAFKKLKSVEYVEPNYVFYPMQTLP